VVIFLIDVLTREGVEPEPPWGGRTDTTLLLWLLLGAFKERGRKSAIMNKILAIFQPYLSALTKIQNLVSNFFGINEGGTHRFQPYDLRLRYFSLTTMQPFTHIWFYERTCAKRSSLTFQLKAWCLQKSI